MEADEAPPQFHAKRSITTSSILPPEAKVSSFSSTVYTLRLPRHETSPRVLTIPPSRFAELCRTYSTLQALDYLQTVLSPIVDSNSPQESLEFSSAMMSVLTAPTKNNLSEDETMEDSDSESGHASELRREEYRERVKMWKEVVWLFDSDVVEPENLLLDLIL